MQAQGLPGVSKEAPKTWVLPPLAFAEETPQMFTVAQQLGAWAIFYLLTLSGLSFYAYRQVAYKEKREDLKNLIKRKLQIIEEKLSKNDWRAVGSETTNLIYSVIGEVAGLGGAAYDFDKIIDKAPPSFQRDIAPKLKKLMNQLEIIGFAPEGVVGNLKEKKELKKILEETGRLLAQAAKYDFTQSEESSGLQ